MFFWEFEKSNFNSNLQKFAKTIDCEKFPIENILLLLLFHILKYSIWKI